MITAVGGQPGYTYASTGAADGNKNVVQVKAEESGFLTVTCTVTDTGGNSASASLGIPVSDPTLQLHRTGASEGDLPAGGKASFDAVLMADGQSVPAGDYGIASRCAGASGGSSAKAETPGGLDGTDAVLVSTGQVEGVPVPFEASGSGAAVTPTPHSDPIQTWRHSHFITSFDRERTRTAGRWAGWPMASECQ